MASLLALVSLNMMALSNSKIRQHARFLSDRMAYELDLNASQYDDVYEINYDFIYQADKIMDDVVDGYIEAIDDYYQLLDDRNDDLRYVLKKSRYQKYRDNEYFWRPIYVYQNSWYFRIYKIYNNNSFFYFDRPAGYYNYSGSHGRKNYSKGYYVNRYDPNDRYPNRDNIRGSREFDQQRRGDFGANLRQRSEHKRSNDYRNANQQNRERDSRYENNSKNVNSPSINKRNEVSKPQNANKKQEAAKKQEPSKKQDSNKNQKPGVKKVGRR